MSNTQTLGAFAACALAPALACSLAFPVHDEREPRSPSANDASDGGVGETAKLLFRSGFEGDVALEAPSNCGGPNCFQKIVGGESGYPWPPSVWGFTGAMQLLATADVTENTIGDFMVNELVLVDSREAGKQTRALFQRREKGIVVGYIRLARQRA